MPKLIRKEIFDMDGQPDKIIMLLVIFNVYLETENDIRHNKSVQKFPWIVIFTLK